MKLELTELVGPAIKHKVELRVGKYGWRYVHVDGRKEPWAVVIWESHGPRGRTWHWRDPLTRRPIMVNNGTVTGEHRAEIQTRYYRDQYLFPGDPGPHRPTYERLLKVSETLIAAGVICNPSETREAMRKKEEARKRKAAQARERERKRMAGRAEACIEPIDSSLVMCPERIELRNKVIANIVAAMKWAQTR